MAKASHPGRTKTRLVPPLDLEAAAALNTVFLRDVADNLAAAGRLAAIAPFMAFGPPGSAGFFEETLPPDLGLLEVWLPSLGDCLIKTVTDLLAMGYGAACVLNGDSPTLPTALLVATAEALARPGDRAVLGPSSDGGYYLLGLKRPHRRLFQDIAWSTERVAAQTLERAAEIDLEVVCLAEWYDVDDAATLQRLAHELREGPGDDASGLAPHPARHTAGFLRDLPARSGRQAMIAAAVTAALPVGGGTL